MKKSLFYDGSTNKNYRKKNSIDILNMKGQIKLSNFIPTIKNNEKKQLNHFELKEDKINEQKKFTSDKCKSKGKTINTLAGKEIKFFVGNKRYLSNNLIKKRTFTKIFNLNNGNIDI